uniref:Serpentine receptor class gamma n=1 Tax=Caenorhabditis tropicalis TaxID=1561998 RepID=A0A1I7UGR9_9PELO
MSYDTSYTVEECSSLLQYIPFRISLLFHSTAAISSFFTTFYFLHKHIHSSPIHPNFKFLLLVYFFNSYARGVFFVGSVISFFYRILSDDIFMNPLVFQLLHLFFALSMIIDGTIKVLLILERGVATRRVERYEGQSSKKWMYSVIIILFPVTIICIVYQNADFSRQSCFAFFAPRNTENGINLLFLVAFTFAFAAFIVLRWLIRMNKKKLGLNNFQLTARYQIRENLLCSHLASSVLLTSLLVTTFYGLSMITLRLAHFQVFQDNREFFSTMKVCLYPFAVGDFIIPMYSGWQINRCKAAKLAFLNRDVTDCRERQKTTEAYEGMLRKQWA